MYSLLDLFSEGDKNVMILVTRGVFPVFMRLLNSNSSVEMEKKTAMAISKASIVDGSRDVLAVGGSSDNFLFR